MLFHMITVIARLPIRDFATWHAEYERMHPVREAHGECGREVYLDVDDPGVVVVVFRWNDVESARGYFSSQALADSVSRAQADAAPEIRYLAPA